ncbi:hypothetical protein THAOC_05308, partial [Thalassiosira oceanica]
MNCVPATDQVGGAEDLCANCGVVPSDTVKLKNCNACRLVKYSHEIGYGITPVLGFDTRKRPTTRGRKKDKRREHLANLAAERRNKKAKAEAEAAEAEAAESEGRLVARSASVQAVGAV